MDWDKLRVFRVVADCGSFTHAADTLHLSQSAVSRQIRSLEDSLNLPLFHRHARGLILTEQGETLYSTAREVFAKLAMTEATLKESKAEAKGPLRVSTTIGFGSLWLTSYIGEFIDHYRDISVQLLVLDVELDLAMRQADVAVRLTPPRQPTLIQRHLFTAHFGIYAAPAYINRFGTPRSLADLAHDHRVIGFGEGAPSPYDDVDWLVEKLRSQDADFKPALTVNNVYGIFRAVQTGIGVATLPAYLADKSSQFVRVLPDVQTPNVEGYFVYPEELRNSRRVGVFRDFLLRKVADTPL